MCVLRPPGSLIYAEAQVCGTQTVLLPVTMQVNLTSLSSDTDLDLSVVSNSGWVSSVS